VPLAKHLDINTMTGLRTSLITVFIFSFLLSACTSHEESYTYLAKYYKQSGYEGSFVLYDPGKGSYIVYNPEGADKRMSPGATSKMLLSLIGLETGVIPDLATPLCWNGTQYDYNEWNRDLTLPEAMKHSAIWYYQKVASAAGRSKLEKYLTEAAYGNADISSSPDTFWLEGSLQVSPREQVDFLKNLSQGKLAFSKENISAVKEMMLLEDTARYKLYGQTGWVMHEQKLTGWFVGLLEQNGRCYAFANQIQAFNPDQKEFAYARIGITRSILKELSLL
jgi:beta-lactamase class D